MFENPQTGNLSKVLTDCQVLTHVLRIMQQSKGQGNSPNGGKGDSPTFGNDVISETAQKESPSDKENIDQVHFDFCFLLVLHDSSFLGSRLVATQKSQFRPLDDSQGLIFRQKFHCNRDLYTVLQHSAAGRCKVHFV